VPPPANAPAERVRELASLEAIDVAAGDQHACVLFEGGVVACWGDNDRGQLGLGPAGAARLVQPVRVAGLPPVRRLSLAGNRSSALPETGEVWTWGETAGEAVKAPRRIAGLPPMTSLASGTAHSCGIDEVSRVWCWGENQSGQLGIGVTSGWSEPRQVTDVGEASEVVAGADHTCARTRSNRIMCWGNRYALGLGEHAADDRATPTPVPGAPAGSLVAGPGWTCVMTSASPPTCWGFHPSNHWVQGSLAWDASPRVVEALAGVARIMPAGRGSMESRACGPRGDTFVCWGDCGVDHEQDIAERHGVTMCERRALRGATALAGGWGFGCAVIGGRVACWERNADPAVLPMTGRSANDRGTR
jgi:hypothetical protein